MYRKIFSYRFTAAVLIAWSLLWSGCKQPSGDAANETPLDAPTQETVVCTLPANAKGDVYVSNDGAHWCTMIDESGHQRIIGDRSYGSTPYKVIADVEWAPQTGRCGFWAQRDDGNVVVVVDDKEFITKSPSESSLQWSDDGTRWMATWGDMINGGRGDCVVLLDGKEIGRYRDMNWPTFSKNSKHYGMVIRDDKGIGLMIDGQRGADLGSNSESSMMLAVCGPNLNQRLIVLDDGSPVVVSPAASPAADAKSIPWSVMARQKNLGSFDTCVINTGNTLLAFNLDNGKSNTRSVIAPQSLVASADGQTVAWWAKPADQWLVFVNGKPTIGSAEASPTSDSIVLSGDGKRVGFIQRHKNGSSGVTGSAVIDGAVMKEYDWLGGITFSKDSKRCAYWAKPLGGTQYVYVLDGTEVGKPVDSSGEFCFSDDGRHWGYIGQRGAKTLLVVDGTEHPLAYEKAWNLKLNNRGRPRFFASIGAKVVSVEGVPQPPATPPATAPSN